MNNPEQIDPGHLHSGPICHRTLSPKLLEQIKAVYDVNGRYLDINMELIEIGFIRDNRNEEGKGTFVSRQYPSVDAIMSTVDGLSGIAKA